MANKIAHSAGIFADMTVDGPEIGTLVLVVDRAKNLPNRKSMGKQNPYCAARLGKEAKKTETDKRGGQTPKWDQELRFTVHDSPDYYSLKISLFSEDKRTDLIGEAFVDLSAVIVPGGGKNDRWQNLNCKGKYAGEIRIELTYYDMRQKPEKSAPKPTLDEQLWQTYLDAKVKRRPLPPNPNVPSTTPVVVPERPNPGRAKHGPRDYQIAAREFQLPARANSMPPEGYTYPHSHATLTGQKPIHGYPESSEVAAPEPTRSYPYNGEHSAAMEHLAGHHQSVDLLPHLPPSDRSRRSLPPPERRTVRPPQQYLHGLPLEHSGHSRPMSMVPMAPSTGAVDDDEYDLPSEYSDSNQNGAYQHQLGYHQRDGLLYSAADEYDHPQPVAYANQEEEYPAPPPPPVHSHSAPAVPYYEPQHSHPYHSSSATYGTHQSMSRQQYPPASSARQSMERTHDDARRSFDGPQRRRHSRLAEDNNWPAEIEYVDSTPDSSSRPNSSPIGPGSVSGQVHHRRSMIDMYSTPPRPHPLSQEVSRPVSPNPPHLQSPFDSSPFALDSARREQESRNQDGPLLIRPRPVSPNPSSAPASGQSVRPRSSYGIQHPIRAFESSDESPLSRSQPAVPQNSNWSTPIRKSISPRPSLGATDPVPYSPESFEVHNPNYSIQSGSDEVPRDGRNGPIVGWHGQEIDPSDHLPVDSWAPEPEKKIPSKTYGLGRDRDFGPRKLQNGPTGGRLSRDTVVNVRMKNHSSEPEAPTPPPTQPTTRRNPFARKNGSAGSSPANTAGSVEPLRDHKNFNPIPNPYAGGPPPQQPYSRDFRDSGAGYGDAPPVIPPKIPLQRPADAQNYGGADALSREISSIDIGGRRSRAAPPPAAYVPVRSQRDRNEFY